MKDEIYNIVVIDDMRIPLESESEQIITHLYKNSETGLAALKEWHESGETLDELWLDHDLGYDFSGEGVPKEDNIRPIVLWLEELAENGTPFKVRYIFVHTGNPYSADWMVNGLRHYKHVTKDELPTVGYAL